MKNLSRDLSSEQKFANQRRGATVVYTAIMLVVMFGMAAFAIEVGMMMVARTNMQSAADSAALAGASVLGKGRPETLIMAKQYAAFHDYLGEPIAVADEDIKIGFWDDATRAFSEDPNGNAVEVTTRVQGNLTFARVLGESNFSTAARSVAVAPARDIVFVVDLSGSMNDDTEPVWATNTINDVYASSAYSGIGDELVQNLFTDLGYGMFPGQMQQIGYSLGVTADRWSYAEMTKDYGVLDSSSIGAQYRIHPSDSEATRRIKCYKYIIDHEIAAVMPNALPAPNSSVNFDYWARYLDYVILGVWVHHQTWEEYDSEHNPPNNGGGDPPVGPEPPNVGQRSIKSSAFRLAAYHPRRAVEEAPGSPPVDRGWLPPVPSNWDDRIYTFNNPNEAAFPNPDYHSRWSYGNKLGYLTYVNFMLDYGRDGKPDGQNYTPLSLNSPDCPMHSESTDGGSFLFPPREQPMHSCRRALISALNVIKIRNTYGNPDQKDQVAIITFDRLGNGTTIAQPLTDDYTAAMQACTTMQASLDKGQSTATEIGLRRAKDYIKQERDGGSGRNNVNKVVVMLTDGLPNAYESNDGDIGSYQTDNPNSNFYSGGYYWLDAPLMQTKMMSRKGWQVHPVGIGFGTNYEFMDRVARMGGTAQGGQSLRGSGNPALYEQTLRDLFEQIVEDPMVNLAK